MIVISSSIGSVRNASWKAFALPVNAVADAGRRDLVGEALNGGNGIANRDARRQVEGQHHRRQLSGVRHRNRPDAALDFRHGAERHHGASRDSE